MGLYYSRLFKSKREKMGCNERDFAGLLEIEESELILIEKYELLPDFETIGKLENLEGEDVGVLFGVLEGRI